MSVPPVIFLRKSFTVICSNFLANHEIYCLASSCRYVDYKINAEQKTIAVFSFGKKNSASFT